MAYHTTRFTGRHVVVMHGFNSARNELFHQPVSTINKWIDASNPSLCRFVPCEKCKRTNLEVSLWTNANPAAGNHKKICSVLKNGQYALKWCKGQQVPFVHQNDSYSILSLIFSHQMLLVIMEIDIHVYSFCWLGSLTQDLKEVTGKTESHHNHLSILYSYNIDTYICHQEFQLYTYSDHLFGASHLPDICQWLIMLQL